MPANDWRLRTVVPRSAASIAMLLVVLVCCTAAIDRASAQSPSDREALISHSAPINSAIYAPDGSLIATASSDQLIKLWETATRKELRTLQGHTGQVLSLAITSDNRTLYSGAADNTIRQWDLPRPGPLHVFEGHAAPVTDVVIGPDYRRAITTSTDRSLRLWDLESNKIVAIWEGHAAEVARIAYRADGNEVASGDAAGTVILWNILTGEPLVEIGAHDGAVTGVAYHPNNQQLVTTGADGLLHVWQLPIRAARPIGDSASGVRVIDITSDSQTAVIATADAMQAVTIGTGAVLRPLEGLTGEPTAVDVSPNNALVATATNDGSIQLHNLADGADRGRITTGDLSLTDVVFHPANDRLASAGADGTIRVWRLPTAAIPLAGNTADVLRTQAAPDGSYVITTGADNSVRMFDPTAGAAVRQFVGHDAAVGAISITPDATQIVTADAVGELRHWNAADASVLARHGIHEGMVAAVAVHPTGKLLATAGDDGTLKTWPLPLPAAKPLAGNTESISAVSISTDAAFALTASTDKSLRKFDATTGVQSLAFEGQTEAVTALALAANDSLVIGGQADGILRVWHADGKPWSGPVQEPPADPATTPPNLTPATLHGHTGAVNQIDVHDATKQFATAGADGTIRIWRLPTAPTELVRGTSEITRHVVSSDGRLAASAGVVGDKPAVFVHDLADGKLIHTLLGHAGPVAAIAFSHDQTQLATGSSDNTARVWSLADAKFAQVHSLAQSAAVTAVAFDSEGTELLVATADNTIRQWSLADATETRTMTGHSGAIASLVVHETTLYSAGADSTVRSWNLATGAAIRSVNHGAAVQALAVTSTGTTIASGGADNTVKLWNAADGAAAGTFAAHGNAVHSLSFIRGGALLVSGSQDMACLWDLTADLLLQSFPLNEWVAVGANLAIDTGDPNVSGDLSRLRIAVAGADGLIRIIQPDLLQRITGHEGEVTGVRFILDGNTIVSCGVDKTVRRWELVDGQVSQTFAGPTDAVTSLAISADGTLMAAGCLDQHVYLWPIAEELPANNQPTPPTTTLPVSEAVGSVSLNADGTRLAIGTADGVVRIRDLANGCESERFFAHAEEVTEVVISADGQSLVSGSTDKTAQLLTASARVIRSDADSPLHDLAFTPDGKQLFAAGDAPQLSAWPLDDQLAIGEPAMIPPADTKPTEWSAKAKRRLAVDPAGVELAVLAVDGRVDRWNLEAGAIVGSIEPLPTTADPTVETPAIGLGSISYDPEGVALAIGTGTQIRIIDQASGRQLEALTSAAPVNDLTFATPSRLAVAGVGGENQSALLDRSLISWWIAHEGAANAISFSTDGSAIVSGGAKGAIHLWNVEQGTLTRSYAGATDSVTDVAFTPDGSRVIASSVDHFVRVWPTVPEEDAASVGPQEWEHSASVREISISADNTKLVTTSDDNIVRMIDLTLGKTIQRWPLPGGGLVARMAPDNKTIVTGGMESPPSVVEANVLRSIAVGETSISDFAVYNNGTLAATATEAKIAVWNLANGQVVREIDGGGTITSLAVRGDNVQLAAADIEGRLHLWNLADGSETTQFSLPAGVNRLSYSADNLKLVAAMTDGGLRFYSPTDGTLLYELQAETPLTAAAIAADSRRVISGGGEGAVALWSYAAPEATRTFTGHGGNVYAVTLSPDNTMIASASADQSIRLWDAAAGTQLRQLTGHVGPVYSVAFSPDGALLVSCGEDKSIRLWDVLGGRQLKQIPVSEKSLYSVAFHPGGQLVAAAGLNKKVYVYNAVAGTLQSTLEGHDDYVYRVAYNRAGNRLVSCGYGGNTILWNPANGQKLFEKTTSVVSNFVDYSPENDQIMVAGGDGRVRFLEIPATAK